MAQKISDWYSAAVRPGEISTKITKEKDNYLAGFQVGSILHLFALAPETFQAIFINLFPASQWSIKPNVTLCKMR